MDDPDAAARESARALNASLLHTEQLTVVVKELEQQLVTRAEEMARVKAACDHAAMLATFVREDCDMLRGKLQVAEAEVRRLTTIIAAHVQTQHYRIYDAATGLMEEGWVNVADMVARLPWLGESGDFPVRVAQA